MPKPEVKIPHHETCHSFTQNFSMKMLEPCSFFNQKRAKMNAHVRFFALDKTFMGRLGTVKKPRDHFFPKNRSRPSPPPRDHRDHFFPLLILEERLFFNVKLLRKKFPAINPSHLVTCFLEDPLENMEKI